MGGGKILLLLLMLNADIQLWGQGISCGEHKALLPPLGPPETWIYDRFGNAYDPDDLAALQYRSQSVCNAGVFRLNFLSNANKVPFPADEQETVCAVFRDISETIGATASATIPVDIIREPKSYGNAAAASDFFTGQCGIAYSTILEALRTGETGLPNGVSCGVIHIREKPTSTSEWFTLMEENGPPARAIRNDEIDLYTTVLHEVLHMLGFASRIRLDGSPYPDAYSTWDKFLYSELESDFLILPENDPLCCSRHVFNKAKFNMPAALTGDCDLKIIFKDNTSVAPVNFATLAPTDNGKMSNKLSHLDKTCGGAGISYVMHPDIAPGELRRIITAPELRILCLLGYNAIPVSPAACDKDCAVIANDDNYTGLVQPNSTIIIDVLDNDAFPVDAGGNPNIAMALCAVPPPLTATVLSSKQIQITIPQNTPKGKYTLCYSISACANTDAASCDQARVYLLISNTLSTTCESPDCNLVCFGDFEDFVNSYVGYYPQIGITPPKILGTIDANISPATPKPAILKSVDTGNKMLAGYKYTSGPGFAVSYIVVPLSQIIAPQCSLFLDLDATCGRSAIISGNPPYQPSLQFFALAQSGAVCPIMNQITCTSTPQDLCSVNTNTSAVCMHPSPGNGISIPYETNGVNFRNSNNQAEVLTPLHYGHLALNWYNNTGNPVTHLLIVPNSVDGVLPSVNQFTYFIDNIKLTASCQQQVQITSKVLEQCLDGNVKIQYDLCLLGTGTTPVNISLQATPSVNCTITPGGGFNAAGAANLSLTPGSDCTGGSNTASLVLTMSNFTNGAVAVQPGTTLTVALTGSAGGGCINVSGSSEATRAVLQYCTTDPDACQTCSVGGNTTYAIGSNPQSSNNLSGFANIPSNPNNACFVVNGTLFIDKDWTVSKSYFRMNEGARIVVNAGKKLILTKNTFEACAKMWIGIKEEGATIVASGNKINDAQYAFHFTNPVSAKLDNNTFDRCYVGIYGEKIFKALGNSIRYIFSSQDTFLCSSALKPAYNGQNPQAYSTVGYAGALVRGTISIDLLKCYFSKLRNAVIAEETPSVKLSVCKVNELIDVGSRDLLKTAELNNFCVWSKKCGTLVVNYCDFKDYWYGVYSDNNTVVIADNNQLNGYTNANPGNPAGYGIYVAGPGVVRYQIKNNNPVKVSGNGIVVKNCSVWSNFGYIANNVVYVLRETGIGIQLENNREGYVYQNYVQDAFPNGVHYKAGIRSLDVQKMDFKGNKVYACQYGIDTQGGGDNNFLDNEASVLSVEPWESATDYGFRALMSTGYYCHNKSFAYSPGQMKRGFWFHGLCNPTPFQCQDIGTADEHGLLLDGNTEIGTNEFAGLNTDNAWDNSDARHDESNAAAVLLSRFVYDPGQEPSWSTAAGANEVVEWFTELATPNTCPGRCPLPRYPVSLDPEDDPQSATRPVDNSDIAAAEGSYPGVALNWMAQQRLYARLNREPEVAAGNSNVAQFYAGAAGLPLGQLYTLNAGMEAMVRRNTYTQYQMRMLYSDIAEQLDSLIVLQEAQAPRSEINAQQAVLDEYVALLGRYQDHWKNLQRAEAAVLLTEAQSIAAPNIPAINERNLAVLYLQNRFWEGERPDQTVLNQLRAIADQCPDDGGFAVFTARAWYRLFEPETDWEGLDTCTQNRPTAARQAVKAFNRVRIMPNPAHSFLMVAMEDGVGMEARFELHAATGAKVLEAQLPLSTTAIDVSMLLPGLYFYTVQGPGGMIQSGKLNIIR